MKQQANSRVGRKRSDEGLQPAALSPLRFARRWTWSPAPKSSTHLITTIEGHARALANSTMSPSLLRRRSRWQLPLIDPSSQMQGPQPVCQTPPASPDCSIHLTTPLSAIANHPASMQAKAKRSRPLPSKTPRRKVRRRLGG